MITRTRAIELSGSGQTLYHKILRNKDGSSIRIRVNGKIQTWKRSPDYFRLPCKHGLKMGYDLTHENAGEWEEVDRGAMEIAKGKEAKRVQQQEERDRKEAERKQKEHIRNARKVGLPLDTPEGIVRDAMMDRGLLVEVAE